MAGEQKPSTPEERILVLERRVEELEAQMSAADRVLSALLPHGSRIISVDGVDTVFVPLQR